MGKPWKEQNRGLKKFRVYIEVKDRMETEVWARGKKSAIQKAWDETYGELNGDVLVEEATQLFPKPKRKKIKKKELRHYPTTTEFD
jgi:hypothetical protein